MTTIPATVQERIVMPSIGLTRPGGVAGGMGLADFMRVVKQRLFLILFVWFLLIGAAVGGTFLAVRYFPLYEAGALLYVEEKKGDDPLSETQAPLTTDAVQRFLKDQAAYVKSQMVLERSLVDAEVKNTLWYKSIAEPDQRIRELDRQLIVTPMEGTSILRIMIRTRSQDDPHRIVNAVVTSYLHLIDERSRGDYRSRIEDYQRESETAKKTVADKLKEIQEFMNQMNQPGVIMGYNMLGAQLHGIGQVLSQLQGQKELYKGLYQSYALANPRDMAISPQMRQLVENDPQVANLSYRLRAFLEEERIAKKKFGPNHRFVKELRGRIEEIDVELAKLRQIRLEEIKQYTRDQAYLAYLNAQDSELSMRDAYEGLLAQQRDLDRQIATYTTLKEELRILEEKSQEIDDHLSKLKAYINQKSTINVRRYADAFRPIDRYFPNWFINVPVGTFAGLLLAVGLAFLLEFIDTSVRSPSDILRHTSLPVLGTVPDADDEEVDIKEIEKAVVDQPHSMVAEAFKTIRTNLFFSAPADRQRTLMVTSPHPEDGKTTVAANLAATVAQSARRVLLVDANFRRPVLGQLYGTGNGVGLSNILIGQKKLEEVVRSTSLPNLDLLPSGPAPPNPAELLGSHYMREMISSGLGRYDQVIFDTPPVLLVSDALVLSAVMDGVVLVTRAHVNSRGVVNRARELLERVNARLFGAVLNAAQVRRGGYFREQLRTFYEYQPEGGELPAGPTPALPPADDSQQPTPGGSGT